MTAEIVKFKCPACLELLEEQDYLDAREEIRLLANELARQIAEIYISELETEGRKIIKKINERLAIESEDSTLSIREKNKL